MISTFHLQTRTFYDTGKLLELYERNFYFKDISFLISLSSPEPGSIFGSRGEDSRERKGCREEIHICVA
jgi:hypothetical protein